MKDFIYKIWSNFLVWFSKLKIFKTAIHHLPIIAYDPEDFKVTGDDVLYIMQVIQPGDVLLRGYDKYLDGKFIPDELGYSHAGLYIGDNQVIHAVNPCVSQTSIIDFCQADRVMVLRPQNGEGNSIEIARQKLGVPYDFNYESDIGKLYCFELISQCHPEANMEEYEVKKFFGLVKRQCFLAKSIYKNSYFKTVFERNDDR